MWYDLVIIGGGINGCGIAADAALRGLSVLLCEKDDIAAHTSSKSSKMIHGGLRYLETYDFSLVKKARDEQQLLLNLAPELIHPCKFVLPYKPHLRPLWQLRAGLFIYDHLSLRNKLPHSKYIRRKNNPEYFTPLQENINKGFVYYDCITDDVALTKACANIATQHGAQIYTHTQLLAATTINNTWQLTLLLADNTQTNVNARALVNASGPWLANVAQKLHTKLTHKISLVKGSHLLLPKLYAGDHAYVLQHTDKRIIFVLPYHDMHLIGTTDILYNGSLQHITIDPQEIDYLCNIVNNYFQNKIAPLDLLDSFSGVRPLIYTEGTAAQNLSRDYIISYTNITAPLVTVYGGKITTYRKLAEEAVDELKAVFSSLPNTASLR